MKENKIRLFATQLPYTDEGLEENEVFVEFTTSELLDEIDDDDISDYAKWNLDMKHEDEFESSLDDFDDVDLIEALTDKGFNFSLLIGEDECIEFLEDSGYQVTYNKDVEYDCIDATLLEEIQEVFYKATFSERQEIRDLILNRK